jgi:hypothetical protein
MAPSSEALEVRGRCFAHGFGVGAGRDAQAPTVKPLTMATTRRLYPHMG